MHQGSSPPQQEPPLVLRAATEQRLGPLQAIYEPGREVSLYRFVSLFSVIIGCLIIFFFFVAYDSLFSGWPLWQALLIPLIGVIWLILAAWIFLTPYLQRRLRIFVYQNGLIYTRGKPEVLRWDQMERLWKDLDMGRKGPYAHAYTVRRSDDTFFVFTGELQHVEDLGRLIEKEITRRLLPRALAAYRSEGPVAFDEIVVSPRGIGVRPGRKLLPWNEFERLSVDEEKMALVLYKMGQEAAWAVVKIASVPNVEVLRKLITRVQREKLVEQLPCVIAYNAGDIVTFGALQVSRQGITIEHGRRFLPWDEIAGVGIGEQEVMIRHAGPTAEWFAVPLWQIMHSDELKELIAYILRGKA